jgi:hypothetical protein
VHQNKWEFLKPSGDCPGLRPVIHAKAALQNQEQFVFGVVMMPDKLALEFDEFDVLTIEFSYDLWAPVLMEGAEFVRQENFLHQFNL